MQTNFGYVQIPKDIKPPTAKYVDDGIRPATPDLESRYKLSSGPVLIMDRRTIKIYAFTMLSKAPG